MINRVIRLLIWSDFSLFFAFGLLAPIFAIFVIQNVSGGDIKVVGLAASFYWVARVLTTVPFSKLMDKTDGELDEYWFLVIGSYIMVFIPLFYIVAEVPWHIYLLGFINGVANSMAVPSWRIVFTNHIDRGHTGYEWSMEDVGVGISVALSSYLGALLADKFGFQLLFILVTVIGVIGITLFILPLKKNVRPVLREWRRKKMGAPRKIDTIK